MRSKRAFSFLNLTSLMSTTTVTTLAVTLFSCAISTKPSLGVRDRTKLIGEIPHDPDITGEVPVVDTCQRECISHEDCGQTVCELGCCRGRRPGERSPLFTQKSPVTQTGHEEITVRGAKRLKSEYQKLLGKNGGIPALYDHYNTENLAVWSAIIGQRWIDLMGFKIGPWFEGQQLCWDAVAQLPDDVQYDHFLRRSTDEGEHGRQRALKGAIDRLKWYFLAAVRAENDMIEVVDGGATRVRFNVRRRFFLFGRALHLLQDSFSSAHAERLPSDGYRRVHNISSYVCTNASPVHPHMTPLDIFFNCNMADNIYNNCSFLYNFKPEAEKAINATSDLWAAFLLSIGTKDEKTANAQIDDVIKNWFQIDAPFAEVPVSPPKYCSPREVIEKRRLQCLDITGRDAVESKRPPFNWIPKRKFEVK